MKRMRPERAVTDLLPVSPRAGAERDNNCVLAFVLALVALQPQRHREEPGERGVGNVPMGWAMSPWGGSALLFAAQQKKVPWSKPPSADGSSRCRALTNPPGMFFLLGSARAARAAGGTFHPMGGCLGTRVYPGTGLSGLMAHPPPQVGPEAPATGVLGLGGGWQQEGPWPSPCAPVSSAGTEANFPVRSPKCSPGKPSFSCRDPAGARRGPHTVNALAGPSPRLVWSWSGKNWNKFGGCCWGHCSHLT